MHQVTSQPSAQLRSQTLTPAPNVQGLTRHSLGWSREVQRLFGGHTATRAVRYKQVSHEYDIYSGSVLLCGPGQISGASIYETHPPTQPLESREDLLVILSALCLLSLFCLYVQVSVSLFHSWFLSGDAVKGVRVGNVQLSHPGSCVTPSLLPGLTCGYCYRNEWR